MGGRATATQSPTFNIPPNTHIFSLACLPISTMVPMISCPRIRGKDKKGIRPRDIGTYACQYHKYHMLLPSKVRHHPPLSVAQSSLPRVCQSYQSPTLDMYSLSLCLLLNILMEWNSSRTRLYRCLSPPFITHRLDYSCASSSSLARVCF